MLSDQTIGRSFWQRFPGILPRKRATEPFLRSVFVAHWDGVNRSRLSQREERRSFYGIRVSGPVLTRRCLVGTLQTC